MSDDLKASALPAYGNAVCQTPNLANDPNSSEELRQAQAKFKKRIAAAK